MSDLQAITKGQPDDDELAAVVLALDLAVPPASPPEPTSRWRAALASRAQPTGWSAAPAGWSSPTFSGK